MKHVYLVLLISVFVVGSAFAGIPDDKDLLLWIGEGSGHTAVDGTGNGNDGTFHGNAKWVGDGKYQAGISLIGAETYMEVPNVLAEAGSLLFWFKPDWNGKDGDDYRIFDASHGPIYFFISKGANHFDFNPEDFGFYFEAADDADWRDVKYPAGVITKDKWFHVAATWNFDGGNPFLYIDGKEAATSRKKLLAVSRSCIRNQGSDGKLFPIFRCKTVQKVLLMKSLFGNAHLRKMRFRK